MRASDPPAQNGDLERDLRRDSPESRRRILLLSMAILAVGLTAVTTTSSLPTALVSSIGPLCLILIVWRRGLDDELAVGLVVLLLDVAGVIFGLTIRSGLAFAVLLPSVAVAAMSGLTRTRTWIALAASAWVATMAGVWLWMTAGPAATLMPANSPPAVVAGVSTVGAFALALLWRARETEARAIRVAREAATRSASSAAELARTTELVRALLDASPVAIQAFAPDRTVLLWNAASERLLGWTSAEVVGKPLPAAMTPPDDPVTSLERIGRTLDGQVVKGDRVRRITKDGHTIPIEIHAAVMRDDQGKPLGIVGVLLDISEREAVERERHEAEEERRAAAAREYELELRLRQAAKMEAVGQLAGGIAHDFNNMLTSIRGFAELARLGLTSSESSVKDDLDQIISTSDRAARLTQQLLTFARRSVVDPRVLDPAEVLETVVPMIGRLVGEDIQIRTTSCPGAGSILVDPVQLEQAIVNLAVNARDAMPHGGRLGIEIDITDVDDLFAARHPGTAAGPYVIIRVSDTGVGMDEETRDHMFEPFFTTKEIGKGTGMGLATVFGIMSICDGAIEVTSAPGSGTTIALYFPRVAEDEQSRA